MPSIRVGAQLAECLRVVGGLNRKSAKDRATELFEAVGLRDPAHNADSLKRTLDWFDRYLK